MATPKLNHDILEKVKQLHGEGKQQNEIGRILGLSRSTVYRAQELLGIHAWPVITEEEEKAILELLPTHSISWIDKELGYGEHQVRLVAKKHGFRRRDGERGYRWKPSSRQFIEIMNLALDGHDSAASIARKIAGPYKPVLRVIHKVRKCARFLTTRTLDSYLPMRHRENQIGVPRATYDDFEKTVTFLAFVKQAFGGELPQDTSHLVSLLVEGFIVTYRRERPEIVLAPRELEKVRMRLGVHFRGALDMMQIADQSGLVN
jgi:hypothetical protein